METVYFMVSVKDDIFSVFYSDNGLQAASVFLNRRKWTRCDYMTYRPYTVCASDTIVFGAVDYNRLSEHTRGGKYYYGYCASDMARRFFEGLILHVKDMHPRFWEKETNGDDVYRRLWFFSRPNTMKPDEMNSYAAMLNSLGVVIDEEDALAAWENEQKENGVFEDSGDQIRAEELLHRIAEGMLIIAKKNYPAEDNQTIKTDISKSFCKAFDDVSATPVFREKIDNWKYEKEELLKQISKDYWKLTLEEVADKTAEEVEKMVGDEIFAWGVSEIKFRWNIAGKVKAKVREWLNQPVLDEIAMSSLVNTRKAVEKAE